MVLRFYRRNSGGVKYFPFDKEKATIEAGWGAEMISPLQGSKDEKPSILQPYVLVGPLEEMVDSTDPIIDIHHFVNTNDSNAFLIRSEGNSPLIVELITYALNQGCRMLSKGIKDNPEYKLSRYLFVRR